MGIWGDLENVVKRGNGLEEVISARYTFEYYILR
jgi:hypothetical protein